MKIIRNFTETPCSATAGAVVAVGNFDGVHRGHQHVLKAARDAARAKGAPFGVMSFEPHPRAFFAKEPLFRLSPEPVKLQLLKALGADFAAMLPFNADLAATEPEDFLKDLLKDGLGAAHVVVGFDFHFGAKRRGTPEFLQGWGAKNNMAVTVVDARKQGGEPVSSSRIREALEAGEVELANALLGYRWFVCGEVIHGEKRGRELGYPTANMALAPETGLAHGIYAIRAEVDGAIFGGAASFGRRPQFDNGHVLLEPYFFDFSGDLYGKTIRLEFISRLRGEERFDSVEDLVAQMDEDCQQARQRIAAADGISIIAGDRLPLV